MIPHHRLSVGRLAIKRDREEGRLTGLRVTDIEESIKKTFAQLAAGSNLDLVREKCDATGVQPVRVDRRLGRIA